MAALLSGKVEVVLLRVTIALSAIGLCGSVMAGQEGTGCEGPPELRAAVAKQPTEEAYNALGYWFTEREKLSCAVWAFRLAVGLNGNSLEARYNLGIALQESGDDVNAAAHLEAAARIAPGEINVQQALGAVLLRMGRWTEAEAAFRAVLKTAPDSEFAREGLARARSGNQKSAAPPAPARASAIHRAAELSRSGDFAGAVEAYRDHLRTAPDDAAARQNLAAALARLGRRAEAIRELEELVRLDPKSAIARVNLGVLYQQDGRAAQAEEMFRHAIQSDPGYATGYLNLGLTLAGQSRFAESEAVLRKARDLAPNNPAVLTALGMAILRQGRHEDALAVLRQALKLQPQSGLAHLNVGIALADLTWRAEAIREFDEAARLDPQLMEAHYNRGRALYEAGRFEDAKAALEKAMSLRADFPPALMMLGMTEISLGHLDRAVELLERSLALGWSDSTAHYKLGRALVDLGREEEGVRHLKRAVELDPGHNQAVNALMRVMTARNAPEAKQYGQQLRDLQREENAADRARVLSNSALTAAEAQDWPKAVGQLREAIETCGECPVRAQLHKNLGLIMAQSGDLEGADAELRIARQLNPADRDTQYALEVLSRLRAPKQQ